MKSYTDIEQSKKLAEFLPLESADCYWDYDEMQKFHRISWFEDGFNKESQLRLNENNVCAWSLAALLGVLPLEVETHKQTDGYKIYYYVESYMKHNGNEIYLSTERHENLVDACYEMILKLHELNLL